MSAIDFAAKDKTKRYDVAKVLANKRHYAEMLQEIIKERSYIPSPARKMVIIDGASKKKRIIYCPKFFPDQCFHHVMMLAAVPVIMKGMSPHCFASVPGRGSHYGKHFIRKWLDTDTKNTKYCGKLDIRKFYPSIPHDKLLEKLYSKFKDPTLLWMFEIVINSHEDSPGRGLAIGFYPSQWLSNFYLQGFDHFVKENLHVKYYGRYMDDIIFFGGNKKVVHEQMSSITEYLESQGLSVKGNWQVYRFDYIRKKDGRRCGRDLDFMGFRFFRDKTIIRRRNSLKIRRTANGLNKAPSISYRSASSMLSLMGWVKHTNSYRFRVKYIYGKIDMKSLKKIVSRYTKKQNNKLELEVMQT